MAQELCQKIENITSFGFNPDQVDKTTPIANLNSDFIIKNGVVSNPELLASVDAASLDANGTINLPRQSLDYTLGLTIKKDLFQKSCGINPALRGTRIPVNCRGAFDTDPVKLCKLDTRFVGDMLKKVAGEKLQAEIDKKKEALEQQAKEKLQDSLKEKLGEQLKSQDAGSLLKGLFGN
jgi:AsmA protein